MHSHALRQAGKGVQRHRRYRWHDNCLSNIIALHHVASILSDHTTRFCRVRLGTEVEGVTTQTSNNSDSSVRTVHRVIRVETSDERQEVGRDDRYLFRGDEKMSESSVARITEISAKSTQGFEDAIRIGLDRAQKTLRNVTSAWVKEQRVTINNGNLGYQVNMEVTFILDE